MIEEKTIRRDHDNLFNYINLNLFCNKLAIGLSDFERSGSKPSDINLLAKTLEDLFDKYLHWSPVSKYNSIVDNLLNSEEEYQLFTRVLKDASEKKISKISELEETIQRIRKVIEQIKAADKITQPTKAAIDSLFKFLILLSDYTVIAQDMSRPLPSSRDEVISVNLK